VCIDENKKRKGGEMGGMVVLMVVEREILLCRVRKCERRHYIVETLLEYESSTSMLPFKEPTYTNEVGLLH
jgi:hypothetical protein